MITNACFDIKDDRYIPYEIIMKLWSNNGALPSSFEYDDWRVVNQNLNPKYYYACVFFGEANWINEILNFKWMPFSVEGEEIADEAIKQWKLDITQGALLIDGPKVSLSLWLINWYANITTIEEAKHGLINQGPIAVWSNSIDWDITLENWIVTKWKSYWHKVIIVWYNEEWFLCENSYWDNKRFLLKYEDFDLLFYTKTVNFINDDRFNLINYYINEAKKMWYKDFLDWYVFNKPDWIPKMLWMLASQIVFLKKVNNKELLKLIK